MVKIQETVIKEVAEDDKNLDNMKMDLWAIPRSSRGRVRHLVTRTRGRERHSQSTR